MLEVEDGSSLGQLKDIAIRSYRELFEFRRLCHHSLEKSVRFKGGDVLLMFSEPPQDPEEEDNSIEAQRARPIDQEDLSLRSTQRTLVWTDSPDPARCPHQVPKLATLNRLIIMATSPPEDAATPRCVGGDNYLGAVLLMMYRTVMPAMQLLEKLIQRFFVTPRSNPVCDPQGLSFHVASARYPVQLAVARVIHRWLVTYPEDWDDDLVQELMTFVQDTLPRYGHHGVGNDLYRALFALRSPPPPPPRPLVPPNHTATWPECTNEIVAQQITLLMHASFRRTRATELVGEAFSKDSEHNTPSVYENVMWFNKFNWWVRTMVLSCPQARAMRAMLSRMIRITQLLHDYHNLSGAMACANALVVFQSDRYEPVWKELSDRDKATFTQRFAVSDFKANFRALRDAVKAIPPGAPCILYMGMTQKDLTALEQGSPKIVDGLVNMLRCCREYNIIAGTLDAAQPQYDFAVAPHVQRMFLEFQPPRDEENNYNEFSLLSRHLALER